MRERENERERARSERVARVVPGVGGLLQFGSTWLGAHTGRYGTSTFKLCFVGSAMTTWLVSQGIAEDRPAAIDLCRRLLEFGFISHVCDDHDFKDEYLFYRFYADALQHAPEFLDFVRIVGGLCYMLV